VPQHLAVHSFKDLRGKEVVRVCSVNGAGHLAGSGVDILCPTVHILHLFAMFLCYLNGIGNEISRLISSHVPTVVGAQVVHFQALEPLKALLKLGVIRVSRSDDGVFIGNAPPSEGKRVLSFGTYAEIEQEE